MNLPCFAISSDEKLSHYFEIKKYWFQDNVHHGIS